MRWILPPFLLAGLVLGVLLLDGEEPGTAPSERVAVTPEPALVPAGAPMGRAFPSEGPGYRTALQMDGTPQTNDHRFHELLREAVRGYRRYKRVANTPRRVETDCDLPYEESFAGLSDAPFEGPAECGTIGIGGGSGGAFASRRAARGQRTTPPEPSRAPAPAIKPVVKRGRPHFSQSADAATHGTKLYWLFVSDIDDYLSSPDHTAVPVGQTIVKEAWTSDVVAEDPGDGRTLRIDGRLYHAGRIKTLFVMTRVALDTPGSDQGWVYGTLTPDGRTVTGSGRIQSCMDCHAEATRERLRGLQR